MPAMPLLMVRNHFNGELLLSAIVELVVFAEDMHDDVDGDAVNAHGRLQTYVFASFVCAQLQLCAVWPLFDIPIKFESTFNWKHQNHNCMLNV